MGGNITLALSVRPRPDYSVSVSVQSIETLVDAHSKHLYSIAFFILKNPADAEDAVQETFLRVVQHRATLSEIEDIEAWLRNTVCTVSTSMIMRSFDLNQSREIRNFC